MTGCVAAGSSLLPQAKMGSSASNRGAESRLGSGRTHRAGLQPEGNENVSTQVSIVFITCLVFNRFVSKKGFSLPFLRVNGLHIAPGNT